MKTNHQRGFKERFNHVRIPDWYKVTLPSGKVATARIGNDPLYYKGGHATRLKRGAKHHLRTRERSDVKEVIRAELKKADNED